MAYVYKEDCGTIHTNHPEHFEGWTLLSEKEGKARYIAECETELRELFKDNPRIYTVLRHVSASGMSRSIDMLVIQDGKPRNITGTVNRVMGWKFDNKHGGTKVSGCGMDMGFHLVNSLSMRLYCPNKYDHDSAYYLKQEWI